MQAQASVKYLRISPRKVRLVLDLVRNKHVDDARDILANLNKKAARLTGELLKSAVANAKVKKMDEETLFISDIRADGGPTMKRFMSRAMGRADRILKRTSHIKVVLIEKKREKSIEETMLSEQSVDSKKIKKSKVKRQKSSK